jgi:hypothetical protein
MTARTLELSGAFEEHFRQLGLAETEPAAIVSKVDPSVRFVGAAISVLKPMLLSGEGPPQGAFVAQPAIRTRCLRELADPQSRYQWSSYFLAFGALVAPDRIADLAHQAETFLLDALGLSLRRLLFRVSSSDRDLCELAARLRSPVEVDGYAQTNYRHRFGPEGLTGRNFNFAILVDGVPLDVGNLIVIEDGGRVVGAEVAFGASVLLARALGLSHPVAASPLADQIRVRSWDEVKCVNALEVCIALASEGLRPVGRGRGRIFRGYLEALAIVHRRVGLSFRQLDSVVEGAGIVLSRVSHSREAVAAALLAHLEAQDPGGSEPTPTGRAAALAAFDDALGRNAT